MENPKYILCKQKHYFYKCDNFKDISWEERIELIEKENYVWITVWIMFEGGSVFCKCYLKKEMFPKELHTDASYKTSLLLY